MRKNKKGVNNQSAASFSVRSYLFLTFILSHEPQAAVGRSESEQMFICYKAA